MRRCTVETLQYEQKYDVHERRGAMTANNYKLLKLITKGRYTHNCYTVTSGPHVVSDSLEIINTDDLIDPTNEGTNFDVNTRHILPATPETPRYETSQFVESVVLAHQGTATITLK